MEAGMKLECESSADRITNLPVDVIHRILVLLPIKDAAKASMLSTKWRQHWRSIPELVFDDDFTTDQVGQSESTEKMNELLSNIYQALLRHDGPIAKFELSVPKIWDCHEKEIDRIIHYLSDRGLQDLTLDIPFDDQQVYSYKLHSSLFSCLRLNRLVLWRIEFRQPSGFVGFSKLRTLTLAEGTLPSDFFQNFLLKCPMLEVLSVFFCHGPTNHEIVAPCLQLFRFSGNFQKIYFKGTPLLKEVLIHNHEKNVEPPADTVALFASLPALQSFTVNFQFLQHLAAGDTNLPNRLPTPLHRLKFLHIQGFDLGCSFKKVRSFVCLIMSSPNLSELKIQLDTTQLNQPANENAVPSIGALLEEEDRCGSDRCLQHLKVFEIDEIHWSRAELDLLRFILATAPLLERVHIAPRDDKCNPTEGFEFTKELVQYKRVSKEAEIIYFGML